MKKLTIIFSILIMFLITSCNFFTTSLGTGLKRDLSKTYSKVDTKNLAQMINTSSIISDKEAGKTLLEELGKRNDISSLPPSSQDDVLNLMVNSSISTETLTNTLKTLENVNEESDAKQIAKDILSSIDTVDVNATKAILENTENFENLTDTTVALATVCLVAQVAKDADIVDKTDTITEEIQKVIEGETTIDDAVGAILDGNNGSDENKESLKIALKSAKQLKDNDAEIFSGVKFSDLFGSNK